MPARKRHKKKPEHPDPVVRFGRALEREKERERAEQIRIQAERDEQKRQADVAAEYARKLGKANNRLERAIAAVKQNRGDQEVEAEYRAAKADVLELETGERPDWAPGDPSDDAATEAAETDGETIGQSVDEPAGE